MNEDGFRNLTRGIVTQAVNDYKNLLSKRENKRNRICHLTMLCDTNKRIRFEIWELECKIQEINVELARLEDFFRSERCNLLCGDLISGERIIKELNKGGGRYSK